MAILPVPGAAGQGGAAGTRGQHLVRDEPLPVAPDVVPSAEALAKGLGLQRPEQSAGGRASQRRADVSSDPTRRLGQEMVEGRQKLEQTMAAKRRLQRRIEMAKQKLEACRSDRERVVLELTSRQCDVQHLFAELDFARQQIAEVERHIAQMRAVRQAFSRDDVIRMERTRSRFESERLALGEDRHDTRAAMQMSQDIMRQDRKTIAELSDKAKRADRMKMGLQSKQALALEDQRQAEQERNAMLYQLELERVKLHTMRSERLDIGNDSREILQEARKLARDTGVEPAVFANCFLPQRVVPEALLEPVDPLAAPPGGASAGAWGPAAEHTRTGENTSAWMKAVYRNGVGKNSSDAPRFSVAGGNVDLTSAPKWAQFGKGGAHHNGHGGKGQSALGWRNAGLLGVPAGEAPPSGPFPR